MNRFWLFNWFYQLNSFFVILLVMSLMMSCSKKQEIESVFTIVSSDKTNVTFKNLLPENEHMNQLVYQYYYTGSGVAIGDINNDGLQDLFFTGNIVENKLYINRGALNFKDITIKAGVKGRKNWCTGTTMADVNNDGYLDIYVCYSGRRNENLRRNELYINNGDETFTEKAKEYGLDDPGYGTQAAFFDYDLDGDLDMYLLNHNVDPPTDSASITKLMETNNKWVGDKLYENTRESGKIVFKDVSIANKIDQSAIGFGLGVSIGDINNDGWSDIYVSNDYDGRDFLYINQGKVNGIHQGFKDQLINSIPHTSVFSMGTDITDLNNDGWLDIMVLDMASSNNFETKTNMSGMDIEKFNTTVKKGLHYQYMYNTLHLNNGLSPDGHVKFSDIAQIANLSNTDWSWGPLVGDFNNDGEKDIYITNGIKRNDRNNDYNKHIRETLSKTQDYTEKDKLDIIRKLVTNTPSLKKSNFLFSGDSTMHFKDVTKSWGMEILSYSNGASYADLDNDGDLEIVVNNVDDEVFIFKNNSQEKQTNANAFVKIKFNGPEKNLFGIGAKVSIQSSDKTFVQENNLTRGYISSVPPMLHFGLGNQTKIDELIVTWPDGKQQYLSNLPINETIILNYSESSNKVLSEKKKENKKYPISFNDITENFNLNFQHKENDFDDYAIQILLPHRYSQFGPALSVADINGDGLDDFYVGGAAGQSGELYLQTNQGQFQSITGPWSAHNEREDISSAFFDANNDGYLDLLVISGGNEFKKGDRKLQDRLYLNTGSGKFENASNRLPKHAFSGSTVKPYDFDGDGDLDLFVGERHIPHNYPIPASGYLYKNTNGYFKDITNEIAPDLEKIGLITDALWSDVNGDSLKDLIVVGEWMGVHIYYNEKGVFKRFQMIPNTEGWWYSLASGDFDNDGDQDIIVGNLGLNYKYKASKTTPFEVFASDFNEDNKFDIILGIHEGDALYPLRGRECSSDQLPQIKEKFPTYKTFGNAAIVDMIGQQKMKNALNLKSKSFATTYFENLGNEDFKPKKLPELAQLSSVNAIEVNDFNKDGYLDLILSGNLYSSEVETPRNDASYGVFLKGNGHGNFDAKYPHETGLYANGDIKNTAIINIGSKEKEYQALIVARNNDSLQFIKTIND